MSVILSNDKPSVNYTITRTTSIFDMIKNLITVFSATPKLQPVYVAQYSEEYMNYSLTIGHLPEYQKYPVYCAWCGTQTGESEIEHSHSICKECKKAQLGDN